MTVATAMSPLPSNNWPWPWPVTPDHDHGTRRDMTITACPTPFLDFPILTGLHSSVNWHLHCLCKVCWSFLEGYPHTGWEHVGFCKPPTCTCENPHPWMKVQVLMGMGAGYPGKPQGSLWHSLVACPFSLHQLSISPAETLPSVDIIYVTLPSQW